jgi:hypothetical protein
MVHEPDRVHIKNVGLAGPVVTTYEQVGNSIADVVPKAVFAVLIWAITAERAPIVEDSLLHR